MKNNYTDVILSCILGSALGEVFLLPGVLLFLVVFSPFAISRTAGGVVVPHAGVKDGTNSQKAAHTCCHTDGTCTPSAGLEPAQREWGERLHVLAPLNAHDLPSARHIQRDEPGCDGHAYTAFHRPAHPVNIPGGGGDSPNDLGANRRALKHARTTNTRSLARSRKRAPKTTENNP